MHSLRFPNLSLPLTEMKLLIQGVALCTGKVLLPAAFCLTLAGTFLSSVSELASRVFAWEVHLNQSVYGNLLPGICQLLERHLDILAV